MRILDEFLKKRYSLDILLNTNQAILKGLGRKVLLTLDGKQRNNTATISNDKVREYLAGADLGSGRSRETN